MKLREWRQEQGLSDAELARRLSTGRENVRRYQLPPDHPQFQMPRKDMMRRIYELTDGQVTANEFHELRRSPRADAEEARA